jgi:hypothetical protein
MTRRAVTVIGSGQIDNAAVLHVTTDAGWRRRDLIYLMYGTAMATVAGLVGNLTGEARIGNVTSCAVLTEICVRGDDGSGRIRCPRARD